MGAIAASNDSRASSTTGLMLSSARPGGGDCEVTTVGRWAVGHSSDDGSTSLATASGWTVAISGVVDDILGGNPMPTGTDVADLIARRGVGAIPLLRGDFALVATDGDVLLAARDHIGTEPLFWGRRTGSVAVAGQPKQVTAGLGISRRMDVDAVLDHFYGRTLPGEEVPCVVESVERVPRNTAQVFTGDSAPVGTRTWTPPEPGSERMTLDDAVDGFREIATRAVHRMLGPSAAVALSGGIDSTAIAGLTKGAAQRPLAVSAVYPHAPSVDESEYIEMMAAHAGLELRTYVPEYRKLGDDTADWVDRCDTPMFGPAIAAIAELFEISLAAGRSDVLSGEMAELAFDLREHSLGELLLTGHPLVLARQLRAFHRKGTGWPALARTIGTSLVPGRLGLAYTRRTTPADGDLPPWLDAAHFPGIGHRWAYTRPVGRRWKDLQTYFAGAGSFPGVEMATICGHHVGARLRRPLVDRDLWDFLIGLPVHVKFPEAATKSMVRRAMRGFVPDAILDRTDKTVFEEDSMQRIPYDWLLETLDDPEFRLPGVRYPELLAALAERRINHWESNMAAMLASIHLFARIAP